MKLRCRLHFHDWPEWAAPEPYEVISSGLLCPEGRVEHALVQVRTCPDCRKFQWRRV
jgi:hypothetical protein